MTTASRPTYTPVARVRDLHKSFGDKEVLHGIDLEVAPGTVVALIGRSGSGKSTILRALAGLTSADSGTVEITGRTAVAFQEPRLLPWKSVLDNVALGLNPTGTAPRQARERASALLSEVHLTGYDDAWPLTLSGGQAQRVSLARALISEPQLLLLDEPFGALDALTRIAAQGLLLQIVDNHNLGALLVTHDVDEAVALSDRVVLLDRGTITHTLEVGLSGRKEDRRSHPDFSRYTSTLLQWLEVTTPA